MLSIRAGGIICQLVDHFLDRSVPPRFEDDNFRIKESDAITIEMYGSMSYYTDDRNYEARAHVIFIFAGNTTVFMATAPEGEHYTSWRAVPLEAWKNTSNHDSCWRSDGVDTRLSEVYFEMCEKINDEMTKDGKERVAPCKMHEFNRMGNKLVEHITIKTMSDDESGNPGYFRKLHSLWKDITE